jgi:hypothetical protein
MESGWAELPAELLMKVLVQALLSSARLRTEDEGGCKASATVRLVCSGWKCRHDALVMRLLLRQDATDEREGVLVRRGGGSLDLKCYRHLYCLNAVTDEGMQAVHEQPYCAHLPRALEVLQGDG